MGFWQVIIPRYSKNIVWNPSFEKATTGWAVAGANTIERLSTYQFRGAYSLRCTYQNNTTLVRCTQFDAPTGGATYFAQARIYVPSSWNGGNIRIGSSNFSDITPTYNSSWLSASSKRDTWFYIETKFVMGADVSGEFIITTTGAPTAGQQIYVDAFMVEAASSVASTYVDGSMPGCRWTLDEHYSPSERDGQIRSGGYLLDFDDYGFHVEESPGIGMLTIKHQVQDSVFLPGATFRNIHEEPRVFEVNGEVIADDRTDLHYRRSQLLDALKPDRVKGRQPVTLAYIGSNSNRRVFIDCYYDSGMHFTHVPDEGYAEQVPIRFMSYDKPFFYEMEQNAASLTINASVSGGYCARKVGGVWQQMGTGLNGKVNKIVVGPKDGKVYYVGNFTTANGVTVNRVTAWNPTSLTFEAFGSGVNGEVWDIQFRANGNFYIVGAFTDIGAGGGTNIKRIAEWNGSSFVQVSGGVDNGIVYAITRDDDHDNDLYICGSFTAVGGGAQTTTGVARYNRTAWAKVGSSGMNAGGIGYDIEYVEEDKIVVTGTFTSIGGTSAANIAYCRSGTWRTMGAGLNNTGYALYVNKSNNKIDVGGAFTQAGGRDAYYAAIWNWSGWAAITPALNGTVRSISKYQSGLLMFTGDFTQAGSMTITNRAALWNGSSWSHLDVSLPGATPIGCGAAIRNEVEVYIGFSDSGTIQSSALTTVSNRGSRLCYPVIEFEFAGTTGTAQVAWIRNETTGSTLWLNYDLNPGEKLTLDLTERSRSSVSSIYGDVWKAVLRNSNMNDFYLLPGANAISVLIITTGAPNATCLMKWPLLHWGVDGVAESS